MIDLVNNLIAALREELQQYGEMLARLDEQQQHVIRRAAHAALESVPRIEAQSAVLAQVREARSSALKDLCDSTGLPESSGFKEVLPSVPSDYRPLLDALVEENNELLLRIHQRARQNHILLTRTVESMQHVINSLGLHRSTPVYNEGGSVFLQASRQPALYEAVC
jgi:hypothetical protein